MSEFIDQTTEALGALPAARSGQARPCLLVLSGPDKGAVHPLLEGVQVLGRSAELAQVVLVGRGLSRSHAELRLLRDGAIEVRDLGSTNGVFVNGEKREQATLVSGDTLALGPEVVTRLVSTDESTQDLIREMYEGANRDPLTGLLNRRSFLQRLGEECAAGVRHRLPAAVALVDVDHFKSVNDRLGHPAGDAVLVELARRLTQALRTEDVVGRYGGEEFILLLRHASLEGAVQLLERVRQLVDGEPFLADGHCLNVTISLGVASLDPDYVAESAVKAADQALYQAKREGRNRLRTAP